MKRHELPDFPRLFQTIAEFLAIADVPENQQKRLVDSRRALDEILCTIYPARIYPCAGTVSKIPRMLLAYPCLGKKAQLRMTPLSKTAR